MWGRRVLEEGECMVEGWRRVVLSNKVQIFLHGYSTVLRCPSSPLMCFRSNPTHCRLLCPPHPYMFLFPPTPPDQPTLPPYLPASHLLSSCPSLQAMATLQLPNQSVTKVTRRRKTTPLHAYATACSPPSLAYVEIQLNAGRNNWQWVVHFAPMPLPSNPSECQALETRRYWPYEGSNSATQRNRKLDAFEQQFDGSHSICYDV